MAFVELNPPEMIAACLVGVRRQVISVMQRHADHSYSTTGPFQQHIEGAIAEACFAKHQNLYWSAAVNTFKQPDVGTWQVRSTTCTHGHCIVRPADHDGERIAFVIVAVDRLGADVIGWISTDQAKQADYWRHDSWWVPQDALIPFTPADPV